LVSDWSSDVCSSDLRLSVSEGAVILPRPQEVKHRTRGRITAPSLTERRYPALTPALRRPCGVPGRVSCLQQRCKPAFCKDAEPRSEERRVGKEWRSR